MGASRFGVAIVHVLSFLFALVFAGTVWTLFTGGSFGGLLYLWKMHSLEESRLNVTICQDHELACVSMPQDEFGTTGKYQVQQFTIEPSDPSIPVYAFCPLIEDGTPSTNSRFPVVFFLQALDANNPIYYIHLLHHIVSRGNCLVFSTVDTVLVSHELRYNQLWNGFSKAVSALSDQIDTSRIGFVGHAFGAGAAPAMYKRALNAEWGSNGAFLFLMSPWFVFDMGPNDWQKIPWQTRIYIQVYEDDYANDQMIAIKEIWDKLDQHPLNHRQYALVRSDQISANSTNCSLPAGWGVPITCSDPNSANVGNRLNGHDVWAVWRRLDAVQKCAFDKDGSRGCLLAFDVGSSPADKFMGLYTGIAGVSRAVKPLQTFGSSNAPKPEPTQCILGKHYCTSTYNHINETYFSGGSGIGTLVLASVGSATVLSLPICWCCCLWAIAISYHTTVRNRMKQEDSTDSSSNESEEGQRALSIAVPAPGPVRNPGPITGPAVSSAASAQNLL